MSEPRQAATDEQIDRAWVGGAPELNAAITLVSYDRDWPVMFAEQTGRIRHLLGDRVLLLEHVGSTSVPGLAAKPIIDILLVLADPADEPSWLPPLEEAGYRLVIREPDWYQHRVLKGPDTDINLHVHPPDSPKSGAICCSGTGCGRTRTTATYTSGPNGSWPPEPGSTCRTTRTPRPR